MDCTELGDGVGDVLRHVGTGSKKVGKRHDLGRPLGCQCSQSGRDARLGEFQKGGVDVRVGLAGQRPHGAGQGTDFVVGCRATAAWAMMSRPGMMKPRKGGRLQRITPTGRSSAAYIRTGSKVASRFWSSQ